MLKHIAVSGLLAVLTAGITAPAIAQAQSTVSSTELESSVAAAPAPNRASVQEFLQDSRVMEQVSRLGVNPADLSARVAAMDEAALSQVAQRTRAANLDLAGGDGTVIISTTAIIIILLVLILVLK